MEYYERKTLAFNSNIDQRPISPVRKWREQQIEKDII